MFDFMDFSGIDPEDMKKPLWMTGADHLEAVEAKRYQVRVERLQATLEQSAMELIALKEYQVLNTTLTDMIRKLKSND